MTERLPRWVWDVLMDILAHEDVHSEGCHCMASTLDKIPPEIVDKAEAIRQYLKGKPQ